MNAKSAWQILGIEPTTDQVAIRRAYAVRLKMTRPEEDPVGFQALRAAYEWVMAHRVAPPPVEPEPEPAAVPTPTELLPLQQAIAERDIARVVKLLRSAAVLSVLPLDMAIQLEQHLAVLAVSQPLLTADHLQTLAWHYKWQDIGCGLRRLNPRLHHAVNSRLDAERWWDQIEDMADYWIPFPQLAATTAAHLLVHRCPRSLFLLLAPGPAMRKLLAAYDRHAGCLVGRIDPARIERCRLACDPEGKPWRRATEIRQSIGALGAIALVLLLAAFSVVSQGLFVFTVVVVLIATLWRLGRPLLKLPRWLHRLVWPITWILVILSSLSLAMLTHVRQ